MNALKNKVQLIGNLGMDPEVKTIGKSRLAKFRVATNEKYRNSKGDLITETQWHTLIAWGKHADFVEKYLTKGKEIAVEGRLIHNNYTDKNGTKHYNTEVQVSEVLILGPKK